MQSFEILIRLQIINYKFHSVNTTEENNFYGKASFSNRCVVEG
jgi:hypothetical protein